MLSNQCRLLSGRPDKDPKICIGVAETEFKTNSRSSIRSLQTKQYSKNTFEIWTKKNVDVKLNGLLQKELSLTEQ